MNFKLNINCDNAAFTGEESYGPCYEVARILREVADRINGHLHFSPGHSQSIRDINGNQVGGFDVTD